MLYGIKQLMKESASQFYQALGSRLPPFIPVICASILIPLALVDSRRKFVLLAFHPASWSKPVSKCRDLPFSCVFGPSLD